MVHALMPLPGALSACPVPKENIVPLHCLLAVLPHSIGLVRTLCVAGIASAAVLLVAFAREEPDVAPPTFAATWNGVERATPAELESAYLDCDRMAMTTLLDFGTAAQCSVVYEKFKERVFGGDFNRLLAWHQQLRTAGAPGDATEPGQMD